MTYYFSRSCGTGTDSIKAHQDTLCQTCVFASGGISGSLSAFWCVRSMKRRRTIFMIQWDQYGFDKEHTRTRYIDLVFLHPVGSAGHVMHSGAFRP
jgi:hypothetical protein